MSISEGSDPYLFRRKMEKTRSVEEGMDGRVFISGQIGIFFFINIMIKVLFPICTLIWRVNIYVSRQGKVSIGDMKVLLFLYKLSHSSIVLKIKLFVFWLKTFSLAITKDFDSRKYKTQIQSSLLMDFSLNSMATFINRRKLAAVPGKSPEGSRNSRRQNMLYPELTQHYISQVSEEIEGRVTKKLSKEFIQTESRILGALSKLDEFLLNPQVRTCSVAVPGTSSNNNSEIRETTGDRSSDYPCPEVRYSSHHSGHLNSPEAEDYPHMVTRGPEEVRQYPHMTTGIQEEIHYCSASTSSGQQKKARSKVQPHFCSENTPATIEADQILFFSTIGDEQ